MIKFLKSIFSKHNENYAGNQVFTYYDPKTKKNNLHWLGKQQSVFYADCYFYYYKKMILCENKLH